MTADETGASSDAQADAQWRRKQLAQHLRRHFGDIDAATVDALYANVEWVNLEAGDVLMQEGSPGDAGYLTLSGRLRVYMAMPDGSTRQVRELGRGEITGEISLYTGTPRSATVVAIRSTLVARLDKAHFSAVVAQNPQISIALTQKIIARLQTEHTQQPMPAPVMVTLLPISDGVAAAHLAERLTQTLARHGRACWVDAHGLRSRCPASTEHPNGASTHALSMALDALETEHDFVLMLADPQDPDWTRLCTRHSDEILLLADATQPPHLHPIEQASLDERPMRHEAAETLLLLHPQGTRTPRGSRRWLERRPVTGHVNLRPELDSDMARLARLLSRTAVGLVLAGGGARGFAHLGIWKTLRQRGIEIDCVGGTSMGAVMAALVAADRDADTTIGVAHRAFRVNPTGDYNLLPLISLIRGRRVRAVVQRSIADLLGGPADIADLWKGYFCVATNYSQGCEVRLHQGDLAHSLLASIAIPGALPPVVHQGDLLCDGGTFNNFPVDVMREMRGVGKVIGVDLGVRRARPLTFDDMPSPWRLLLDRLRPRRQRRYKVPSLVSYLLNVTILYSVSRQAESQRQTDLYLNPPLLRVGLLQWNRFADIVQQGAEHAHEVLDGLSPDDRRAWGLTDA